MLIFFLLGLLLGGAAVIFVLENVTPVTVTFFSWQLNGSLAAVVALSVFVGIIIALLILLPASISDYFKYKKLQKENEGLAEELRKQKELTVFAAKLPPSDAEIAHIEEGATVHFNG